MTILPPSYGQFFDKNTCSIKSD
ncbi:MAG TPA: hypothetical protein DDX81_10515 [Desulfofustis sp.]|nr:hypothetical protein [Desulfofustis sp.]